MGGGRMKVALIGGGDWGETWFRKLKAAPQVEFAGIWDASENVRSRWQARANVFPSFDAVFEAGKVDAAIICTPPDTHTKLVETILSNGMHALIEKPFGFHSEPVTRLFDLACRMQKCLMVNFTFLYTPAFEALRERAYGQWHEYNSLRLSPRKYFGNIHIIDDLVVHDLAMLVSLHDLLDPLRVRCELSGRESDAGLSFASVDLEAPSFRARILASCQWPWKRRDIALKTPTSTFAYDDSDPVEPLREYAREGSSLVLKSVIKTSRETGLDRVLSEFITRAHLGAYDKDRLLIKKINQLRAALHESWKNSSRWVLAELAHE